MQFDFSSFGISESFFEEGGFLDLTEASTAPRECDPKFNGWGSFNHFSPNSIGLRGPDPSKVDILAAGCSQTFGIGVDEPDTWPAVLSNLCNMTYANIGTPGGSIQVLTDSVMAYVRDYGAPKVVCVNLPDPFRMTLATRSDLMDWTPPGVSRRDPATKQVTVLTVSGRESNIGEPAYSKTPHRVDDVIPLETAMHFSLMALSHLIEFCSAANIPLLLSSWSLATDTIIQEKKLRPGKLNLSTYLPMDSMDRSDQNAMNFAQKSGKACHQPSSATAHWEVASDNTHMGVHAHLHFAELFANKINALTQD